MPRTSPLCNYFVFFKYITNSRCLSTLFSALCCFGAQFTILSFSPPALRGAKRRTMYPPASCALFSHREGHIVRPPTYNPHNTLGIKLPRLANTFFCLSIPPKNSRGQSPRLSVSSKAIPHNSKEPLNNSLCSVSTQCISRHLPLVKMISAQNSHYLSAFLLLFLKKGRLPLYQVAESFRPAMASAYKLAQANIAYSRFSFFFRPRYTVFL